MYVAQECITEHYFSKAADVFSLGISILELATDLALPTDGLLWRKLREESLEDKYYDCKSKNTSRKLMVKL